MVKKLSKHFSFEILTFSYFFIQNSSLNGGKIDIIALKNGHDNPALLMD